MEFVLRIMKMILIDDIAEKKLGQFMYKMYKVVSGFRKKIGKIKSIYAMYMNPNNWFTLLKNMPRNARQRLFKELAKMESETHEEQVFKTDKEIFNRKMNEMQEELKGESHWVELSSSWIKRGRWNLVKRNEQLGNLMIETKNSTTIYTYPMFPYEIWVLMKEANGYNGGGAGTVLWHNWLHKWLNSQLRAKTLADLKMHHITKDEADQVFYDTIDRTGKGFYQKKNDRINNKDSLGKDQFYNPRTKAGFTSRWRKEYKKYYRITSERMEYKSVTTRWRKYGTLGDNVAKLRRDARKLHKQEILYKNVLHPLKWGSKMSKNGIKKNIKKGNKQNEKESTM